MANYIDEAFVAIRADLSGFEQDLDSKLTAALAKAEGQGTIKIGAEVEGLEDTSGQLEEMGTQAIGASEGLTQTAEASQAANLGVAALGTSVGNADRGLGEFQRSGRGANAIVDELGRRSSIAGAALRSGMAGGVTAAALALGLFAKAGVSELLELDAQVRRFQSLSGASAEDASRFIAVLDDFQLPAESGANALFILGRNAASANKDLEKLGIVVERNVDGTVNLTETTLNVADAIAATSEQTERISLATAAFGKSGRDLIPVLEQGRAGLQEFFDQAERFGQIRTEEDVQQSRRLELALDTLSDAGKGFQRAFGASILPTLLAVSTLLGKVSTAADKFSESTGGLTENLGGWLGILTGPVGVALQKYGEGLAQVELAQEKVADGAREEADAIAVATSAMLANLDAASAAFDERFSGFIPTFGEDFREQADAAVGSAKRASAAGSDVARAREQAADQISDAERAITDAIEQGSRDVSDARRAVAEAEESSARRIRDARQSILDIEERSGRSVRDARQRLADIQAELAGSQNLSTADAARLRDAQEGLSDAQRDAASGATEAATALADAQAAQVKAVSDARLALERATTDSNGRIADAERRLADAQEDAAERIADAQRGIAESTASSVKRQELSYSSLIASFRRNAKDVTAFTGLLGTLEGRLAGMANDDIVEAFLANLADLGPRAVPLLQSLVDESDSKLDDLVDTFGSQVRAAKSAADLEFDKFPDNFEAKLEAANRRAFDALDHLVDRFEQLPKQTGVEAEKVAAQAHAMARQIQLAVEDGNLALTPLQEEFLQLALDAKDSRSQVVLLRTLLEEIDDARYSFELEMELKAKSTAARLNNVELNLFPKAHAGVASVPGAPGEESPWTLQAKERVVNAQDNDLLTKFLRSERKGSAPISVVVNEVASDPEATAFAVSSRIAAQGTR